MTEIDYSVVVMVMEKLQNCFVVEKVLLAWRSNWAWKATTWQEHIKASYVTSFVQVAHSSCQLDGSVLR